MKCYEFSNNQKIENLKEVIHDFQVLCENIIDIIYMQNSLMENLYVEKIKPSQIVYMAFVPAMPSFLSVHAMVDNKTTVHHLDIDILIRNAPYSKLLVDFQKLTVLLGEDK